MKLLSAKPSPFARKVRVALIEKGIPFDTLIDSPWNADSKASGMNPLGKVPALDIGKDQILFDSKVIIEYLETLGRDPVLLPTDPFARVAHKQIEALADGVCDAIVLTVIEGARAPEQQSTWWIERQRGKATAGIAEAARLLGSRQWFVGDAFGLADIAVGCMLGYVSLRAPYIEWKQDHPNLEAFSARMESRPSFRETVPEPQTIDPVH